MNARVAYIDRLKGIAIFLVVLGHVIGYNDCRDSFLWQFIYSFHMPLFMFISGYVAQMTFKMERINGKSSLDYLRKKFRTLLLPMLMWGVAIPYCFLRNVSDGFLPFCVSFVETWGGGLWFFNTLFILSSIFLFYRWIWQRIGLTAKWMEALLIAGMFVCIVFLYKVLPKDRVYSEGLRSVFSYYPFYFLGVIGYKWEKLRSALIDNQRMFTVCLVLFCLLIPSFVYDMSSAINQLMKILLSCMAIPVLFYAVNHLSWRKWLDDLLQCFGRESLSIYVTHNGPFSFLLIVTDYVAITSVDHVFAFLFLSLFSLFVCLSSIGIKRFFTLSEFFGFVLYGKRF